MTVLSSRDISRSMRREGEPSPVMAGLFRVATHFVLICALCCWSAVLAPVPALGQDMQQVLVLHSYHKGLTWTDSEDNGIRSVLQKRATEIEVHTEYLDTKTVSDEKHYQRFFELMKNKYASIPLKIVIATDDDAYNFYLKHHDALFPGAPVVFCGVNYFKDAHREGREDLITGVVEAFDIQGTLRTALRLHLRTSRIIVINDKTTTGIANRKVITQEVAPQFAGKVKFVFYEDFTMPELLEKVRAVSPDDIILLMTFNKDRAGRVFNYDQSIALIAKAAKAPIYGVWDFYLDKGLVGGMLTSGVDQGRMAAEIALRVLDGEKVRAIPVVKDSPNRYKFDYVQLKRFGVNTSDLPPGSMVINEPVSFYSLHKGLVWGALSGFLSLTAIIIVLLVTIRQRKQAEQALRESETQYRTLINNINIGVYRNTGGPHGRFIQANPAIIKILGYSSLEDFLQIQVADLYQHPDERGAFADEVSRNGFAKKKELALRKKDGTPIWCSVSANAQYDENGAFKFMDGVIEDITERRRAEEALKTSERKFRELFEESKDVIFFSSPEGKYVDINPAGVEMYGYSSKEELLAADIVSAIYVDPNKREKFQADLESSGFVKDYELLLKRKDGEKLNALVTASAVHDESGRVVLYRGIIHNVTNQRRLEAQLLQSQKMEAIGQLSGGIAHDFNNILTAVMGYASLLRSKVKQDPELQAYADQILTASMRAKTLTQNLLAFSRKQTLHPAPMRVNEIIKNIERMLIQLIREDIALKAVFVDEEMTIMADSGQIEQILVNLVTNARDAMPHGGTLTIETKLVDVGSGDEKHYLVAKKGKYACISVTDTGSGMDEKTRQKIFEPFFTTKEMGKGTGLGLSIVYGIVKQHNGEINVYSEPGVGTTFRIYFPLIALKAEETRPQELPEPKGGNETLLLAEDDADVRNLTRTILIEAGYTVLEAIDGEDAIRIFSENQDRIQLVLLDVIMPKKNGKEAYNSIKQLKPSAKVLFMSGYSPDVIFKKGVLEEGLDLISKPATPHEILRKVREVLERTPEYEDAVAAEAVKAVPAAAKQHETKMASDRPKHEGTVIIVDDDRHVLEYVTLVLGEYGYSTYPCGNARQAVEILRDHPVDVVLTDIVMPGMSGLELLETVHDIDPDMPVILVTAFADLGKAVESIKKGAFDFIMKPYDQDQLIRALDKAVRYRNLVRIEKEYKDRLEEFNKEMETLVAERSMNLMALTVADRVRNPATVIALACKKIMGKDIPEELKKYVSFIRDESDKLEAMVKSFHDLLGSTRSVFGYEDVNDVVKNVISLIEKEGAAKGVKLVVRLAKQPLKINMQKNLMRVAIQHVLRNAIEATPSGGKVSVTSAEENDRVLITIVDTGSGIPTQDHERIFDPFYSTKEHRYGMGLPLIKQVVSEHMGEIELKSEMGKGTIFRMVFPTHWQEK